MSAARAQPPPATPFRGRFKRDMIAVATGQVAYALGQWAVGASLAKMAGIEAMATYGLALAISSPIYFLTNMSLRTAVARDAGRAYSFSDYLRARMIDTGVALLAMTLAAFAISMDRGGAAAIAVMLFAFTRAIDVVFDLIYGAKQRNGDALAVGLSLVMRGLLAPTACVIGLHLTGGALWSAFAAMALVLGAALLATEWGPVVAARAAEPTKRGGVAVIRHAWPLGVGAACIALETAIPRYMIEAKMAPDALGYFTALFLFFLAPIVAANAFGSGATPYLGRTFAAGDRGRFVKLAAGLVAFAVLMGCGGMAAAQIFGEWALSTLYTPAYAKYADVLILIMAAASLRAAGSLLQTALVAAGRFKSHMAVHAGLALLALATAPGLIDAYGLAGAAWTLILVGAAHATAMTALLAFVVSRMPAEKAAR